MTGLGLLANNHQTSAGFPAPLAAPCPSGLMAKICDFINGWNKRKHPFIWIKTSDEILTQIDCNVKCLSAEPLVAVVGPLRRGRVESLNRGIRHMRVGGFAVSHPSRRLLGSRSSA